MIPSETSHRDKQILAVLSSRRYNLKLSGYFFQYNIRSYPTTILYNNSIPHQFTGHHTAADLVEFIEVSKL